jgi:hypothetical protein
MELPKILGRIVLPEPPKKERCACCSSTQYLTEAGDKILCGKCYEDEVSSYWEVNPYYIELM